MNIKKLIHSINIKERLILYFLIVAMIPTILISAGVYIKSSDIITSRINKSAEKNLTLLHDNLLLKLSEFDSVADSIYLNPDFLDIISSIPFTDYYGDYYSNSSYNDDMSTINELTTINRLMDEFIIKYPNNTVIPSLYIYNKPQYNKFTFTNRIYDISTVENEDWYINLPSKFSYYVIGCSKSFNGTYMLKVVKRLYGLRHMEINYSGLLLLDINVKEFNSILDNLKLTPNSNTIILDSSDNIMLSDDYSLIGQSINNTHLASDLSRKYNKSDSFLINNSNMLVSIRNIDSLKWRIINYSPISELKYELYSYKRVIITVIILCLIIGIILSLSLSSNITYPINLLVNSMYVTENGDFNTPIIYERKDEFSIFVDKYNEMIYKLKDLIYKLYISEINEKDAELKSLQAQINPHFLYNTLDSINWMAINREAEDISIMVTALSDFFRYSLSKGKSIIAINEEKKQIESYLAIQKMRFQDKIDYTIDFHKEVFNFMTVKLIIQPLVENSIVHGIEKLRRKGFISIICFKQKELIIIKVSDDGLGCDVDLLNTKLNDPELFKNSVGIYNVNQRIKKVFGSTYGLNFEKNKDNGVTATITFPAIEIMGG